ncbi:MAG: MlaD family protein [Rhodobacterales bacterium]|nr:MlaD family protein [Rhodobacterales bacterium]
METRANYILIGAFTLLGIFGSLAFAVWLSSVQLDRQYAQYGILFDDVSGLSASGDVVFNGINVGSVIELHIFDPDPSKVYVGIEVDAETPIRTNTVAQLSSSGVTGVAYISLTSTGGEATPLISEGDTVPLIPSRRSTVQQLVEDAPDLISEATKLLTQFQTIAGPENQKYVANILSNLSVASGGLENALTDFSAITGTVSEATAQISRFSLRLEAMSSAAEQTMASATDAFDTANAVIGSSGSAIDSAGAAFAEAEALMRDQVPGIAAQVSETLATLNGAITDLSSRSAETLGGFDETAGLLNARLTELETTLAEASASFDAVTSASDSFYALVEGDGTQLVADARDVLAEASSTIVKIGAIMDEDVPAMTRDIRSAVATASQAVDKVAGDLAGFTDRLDPLASDTSAAVNAATDMFTRATTTLDGIDNSLVTADKALVSAQQAFDSADEALSTDFGPALADIRAATDRIGGAAQQVSQDLPQITADLRGLIARADGVVAQVQSITSDAAPGIRNFTANGLNELGRLSGEARTLVRSLEQLVRRIGNNPARFLLQDRVPEYRR